MKLIENQINGRIKIETGQNSFENCPVRVNDLDI